jgi:hypothetical protein
MHVKFGIDIDHKCKYIFAHEELLFLKADYMTTLRKFIHIVRYLEYWENLCTEMQSLIALLLTNSFQ